MQWQAVRWQIPLDMAPAPSVIWIGQHVPGPIDRYQMHGLWCVHLYRYPGELRIDGQPFPIRPGHASVTPPDAVLEYAYGARLSVHVFAHFALAADAAKVAIPAMQDLGAEFEPMSTDLEAMVSRLATQPARAVAKLWEILWRLAERGALADPPERSHPAVRRALELIELRLSTPIGVAELAEEVGLSRNHLTRLFGSSVGSTVVQYIRQRRVERARHLLAHSTRPIKSVASEVGIPDLQLFNKTMRKAVGMSPRRVRDKGAR